jgi:hypothetical protein
MQRKPFAEWLAENKCNFSSAIIIIGSDIINIGRCFYLPKQIVRRAQIEEAGKPTPQINEETVPFLQAIHDPHPVENWVLSHLNMRQWVEGLQKYRQQL